MYLVGHAVTLLINVPMHKHEAVTVPCAEAGQLRGVLLGR